MPWIRILLANVLLVVTSMALILVPSYSDLVLISTPIYTNTVVHAKEAVLRDDLFTMRSVIDQYTLDKQKAPQSLQDLVSAGYLHSIPKDPFTNSADSWQVTSDDSLIDPSQTQPRITDVHSESNGVSMDGTAYNSW